MTKRISYPQVVVDRAKADGKCLITLEIDTRFHRGKEKFGDWTIQGPATDEHAKDVLKLITKIMTRKKPAKKPAAST